MEQSKWEERLKILLNNCLVDDTRTYEALIIFISDLLKKEYKKGYAKGTFDHSDRLEELINKQSAERDKQWLSCYPQSTLIDGKLQRELTISYSEFLTNAKRLNLLN